MRAATYTRISTDEEHQPYSLEAQPERLGAYIRSQDGWELTIRYTDQMSGRAVERPGLQKALAGARMNCFDPLLVYRVDRLSRSVRGLEQILEISTAQRFSSGARRSPSIPGARPGG